MPERAQLSGPRDPAWVWHASAPARLTDSGRVRQLWLPQGWGGARGCEPGFEEAQGMGGPAFRSAPELLLFWRMPAGAASWLVANAAPFAMRPGDGVAGLPRVVVGHQRQS